MSKPVNPENGRRLKALRQTANLSQRDLANLIGETHTNVAYWETSGNLPRSNVLVPMAKALGVTVEELLGEARPKRALTPSGRALLAFDAVSKLPKRQQQKTVEVVEAFVAQNTNEH